MKKKKTFIAIFAHPDDEAFGPSGTLHKLTEKYDVYILCATKGQVGQDSESDQGSKLSQRRAQELLESAKIIGIKKVYFLGFRDGTLCNNLYHKVAAKIQTHLEKLQPEEIMIFGANGVSGHLDHIAMHYISLYVFTKLPFIKKTWQTVLPLERSQMRQDYFVYFPPGLPKTKIDKIVDVSDVWETKLKAMQAHKSQRHDYENIIKTYKNHPKEEYFMILKKF